MIRFEKKTAAASLSPEIEKTASTRSERPLSKDIRNRQRTARVAVRCRQRKKTVLSETIPHLP